MVWDGLAAGIVSGLFGQSSANQSMRFQKEVAQHGVRWRMNDLKAAGLNPIMAAGGAASASGGAQAQMPDLGATVNNAKQVKLMANKNQAEVDVLKSQAELNRANAKWGGIASPGRILEHLGIPNAKQIREKFNETKGATKDMSGGHARKKRRQMRK